MTSPSIVTNARVIFNEVPTGYPVPGKTIVYDSSQNIDLNLALDGGFLIKTIALSIDPYMRGRMRDPSIKSYSPPYTIGEPLAGAGIGIILRSENDAFQAGDHVTGSFTHEEYLVRKNANEYRKVTNEYKLPWTAFVGVLGMPGLTAYAGWKEYADASKGDVAFVTAGAGPVGSLVIQLAKLDGCKVIASAGSDEKVNFLKEIGADVAFNYKTTKTSEVLEKEGPINIYWDNVGGSILEAALTAASKGARFIECGMIESYNSEPYHVKNLMSIVSKELKISGFIVGTLAPKYREEFIAKFEPAVGKGEIKWNEDRTNGLEHVGDAILAVQKGTNKGKSVVIVGGSG